VVVVIRFFRLVTVLVFVISAAVGVYISIFDFVFSEAVNLLNSSLG